MLIKTERCAVRRFEEEDLDRFMEYRNDEGWMLYQGFKGLTRQAYAKHLLGEGASLAKGMQYAIVLSATNRLIGDLYLKQEGCFFWVGYSVHPAYARQGYIFEVLSALVSLARQQGVESIKAGVLPENTPSICLLKKLGFSYVSVEDGEQIYELHPGNP